MKGGGGIISQSGEQRSRWKGWSGPAATSYLSRQALKTGKIPALFRGPEATHQSQRSWPMTLPRMN